MRRLGFYLLSTAANRVEAMSLYHHVADKGEVLEVMVAVVVGEINARVAELDTPSGGNWKAAVGLVAGDAHVARGSGGQWRVVEEEPCSFARFVAGGMGRAEVPNYDLAPSAVVEHFLHGSINLIDVCL